ncbi:MAG: hypothetical protein FD145_334 [Candidatus Saganbacteria bacterium]|uniref:TIGR00282 family metallophosphoesterase n=1 Tax=Candidatus Saganbacteria bacterium TaxID=2575572 RepID=A0A833L220_UNCSA|nr:MAG: hypothetical protein FD145_334 [Candidatus Saganbacteria bacterium]
MNILFIGDIVGSYGRTIVKEMLPEIKKTYSIDAVIANGENSAHGYSISEKIYNELISMGVDAITMGNHLWEKKEIISKISSLDRLVRPANFPPSVPGNDHIVIEVQGIKIGIVNFLGRVFMQCMDCPFQTAEKLIPKVSSQAKIIIVDIHAEATSEKCAFAHFLDGRASAVVGTHTHVMTADERILPEETAFISDVGMVGAYDSIIGMNKEQIIKRFVTQMPEKFEPTETGRGLFNAVVLNIDPTSGRALSISRISKLFPA